MLDGHERVAANDIGLGFRVKGIETLMLFDVTTIYDNDIAEPLRPNGPSL